MPGELRDTHYVPYFTRQDGKKQQAACGEMVTMIQHDVEPSCGACWAWLQAEAAETAESRFGTEPAAPVRLNTFDPLNGYRERKGMR